MEKPPMGKRRSTEQRKQDTADVVEAAEKDLGPEDKGSKGGGRYEHVQRDLEIWRAYMRGVDHYDLAATYGLTPKTVRAICNRMRDEGQRLSKMDPLDVVEEISLQIDAGISEIAAVAARETGSVRVSAVLGRINALIQKGKWLQQAGVLPTESQELNIKVQGATMAQDIMAVLRDKGVLDDPEMIAAIGQAIGRPIEGHAEEIVDAQLEEGEPPDGE